MKKIELGKNIWHPDMAWIGRLNTTGVIADCFSDSPVYKSIYRTIYHGIYSRLSIMGPMVVNEFVSDHIVNLKRLNGET